jgi:hypothetical protein
MFFALCVVSTLAPFKDSISYLGSPESGYGFDRMSLKKFPTPLLSTDLILLISFDEYCFNVRFVFEIEVKLVIENVTFAAFCREVNDMTKSLSIIFQL